MARLTRFLGNCAVVVASLLFAAALAEGVLRILPIEMTQSFSRDRGYFSLFDQKLGWRAKPLVHSLHTANGFSVDVSQNSLGLRGPEDIGPARSNDKYRVLVLGDSYVWGYGAAQEDMFQNPAVHGRDDIEMVNFGVSGYGTDQELLWYRDLGTRFDVDKVVLAITLYNDVSNNLAPVAYRYAKPYFDLGPDGLTLHDDHIVENDTGSWKRWMLEHIRLAALLDTASQFMKNASLNRTDTADALAEAKERILLPGALTEADTYGLDLTVAIIAALRADVEAQGAELLVTYVPYKPNILGLIDTNHPYAAEFTSRIGALGIETFDPYAEFLTAARQGVSLFNGLDNHFNAAGHKVFAKALSDHLPRP
jgi:lysophospholipase L1-like esterase